jgi:hypothetical protein
MASDERERLIQRTQNLRQLHDRIDDGGARTAITAEIAKHEALIAEIDKEAASEKSSTNPDADIMPQAQSDIIS